MSWDFGWLIRGGEGEGGREGGYLSLICDRLTVVVDGGSRNLTGASSPCDGLHAAHQSLDNASTVSDREWT